MVDGFRMWLQVRGLRPASTKSVLVTLKQYLAFCDGADPLVRQSIAHYLSNSAETVKRITLRNRYDHLRLFCEYVVGEGIVTDSPIAGLPRPRVTMWDMERDPVPITEEMLGKLVNVCPTWTITGLRNRAVLLTLWDTPLRAKEVCGLEVKEDLTFEPRELKVRDGKGGVRYDARFSARTGLAIQRYHRERDASAHVFARADGEPMKVHALEANLRRLSGRAEIEPAVYPHQFRHNFRRRCREAGMDDVDISALMGHMSVVTPRTYAREAARRIAKERAEERLGL